MTAAPALLGVSLKMYFTHERTLEWMRQVAGILSASQAVADGDIEFFVAPSFPALKDAVEILHPNPVGAQDVAATDLGAYTGEVSAAELAEIGVSLVEIGHAERRRYFGEDDETFRAKCRQVLNHDLTPLLCVGEPERQDPVDTVARVVSQASHALLGESDQVTERVVLAYEPYWAIGAAEAAPAEYVQQVCRLVKEQLQDRLPAMRLIYGGSAGPGTLTSLGDAVDGLFLGRFAHDPANVEAIIQEATR